MRRFALDMIILLLLLLVMGFHFLPHVLHEVLGLVLLGGTILHLLPQTLSTLVLCVFITIFFNIFSSPLQEKKKGVPQKCRGN